MHFMPYFTLVLFVVVIIKSTIEGKNSLGSPTLWKHIRSFPNYDSGYARYIYTENRANQEHVYNNASYLLACYESNWNLTVPRCFRDYKTTDIAINLLKYWASSVMQLRAPLQSQGVADFLLSLINGFLEQLYLIAAISLLVAVYTEHEVSK